MQTVTCALCGGDRSRGLFRKRAIPYFKCPDCGFIFSRPVGNANFETTIDAYEPAYLNYLGESPGDARSFEALLRWAGKFGALDGQRVLDVGSGSGKFVRFLRRRGIQAWGIEPAAAIYSRFLANEPFFFPKTIEEFAEMPAAGRFGAIFACDVIEHVEQPARFLASMAGLLEPGGRLFVTTPDAGSLTARLCGRWWHYYNKYHLSYLSRQNLARLAGPHRLREVGFARPPRLKSVGYLIEYLLNFVLGCPSLRMPKALNRLCVPVNLHDTMFVAFERDADRSPATGPTPRPAPAS